MEILCRCQPEQSSPSAAVLVALLGAAPSAAKPASAPEAGPQTTRLGTVEVQETKGAIEAERALAPGAVSVVDAETFYDRPVDNMTDALRYVPGLWTESGTGGDADIISSRGSNLDATDYDSNGIKLFQDGLPVTTADGNNHNRFLDPMAARQVVVARGANALTYGASNLGGAIDVVSPTARNSPAMQVFFVAGSDGQLSGRLTGGGVFGDFDGQATLEAKKRDGYRDHTEQERASLYPNAGWRASNDFDLRVFANHIDNNEELAGALTRAQFNDDPHQANPSAITGNFQLNVKADRLAAKGAWNVSAESRLEFGVSYEDQNLYHPIVDKTMVDFDGTGPNPPVEVFSLLKNTDQHTRGGMLRYNIKACDHDVLAGINVANTH